jgi:mono/diheme cytochrome c family protein
VTPHAKEVDTLARRLIRAAEESLRRWIGVGQLDNDFLGTLYLRVREVLERGQPAGDEATLDDVALTIYLTASAWQAGPEPPLALLSSLHQVIRQTVKEEGMKPRSIVPGMLALVLVVALPMAAYGGNATSLFKSRCAPCHGADGTGNTPMGKKVGAKSLGSPEVQKLSDAVLLKTITDGKGKMPAFGPKLSAAQVADLLKLVRGLAAK